MSRTLELEILPQPDDRTCGVTCLHAVYAYHGLSLQLHELIDQVEQLDSGGTLAVMLACDALRRGFDATIHTCNLHVFDPTWFADTGVSLQEKLLRQANAKDDPKLRVATQHYVDYLDLGGRIRYGDIDGALIRRYLNRDRPILTGLSATYLYASAREVGPEDEYDDILGEPQGHFVVLTGYDKAEREVSIADPWMQNPITGDDHYYSVEMDHLIASILLGIVTYDANMLVIEPKERA